MELWIARDIVFNDLYLYDEEPIKDVNNGCFISNTKSNRTAIHLNDDAFWFFKEITWENSPQKVEINLVKNV